MKERSRFIAALLAASACAAVGVRLAAEGQSLAGVLLAGAGVGVMAVVSV